MYHYTVFDGFEKIITGELEKVLLLVKKRIKSHRNAKILIFSDLTGKQMDFDLSGSESEIIERHKVYTAKINATEPTVGRPKLGVIPREISLLPIHWEWLNHQVGGTSATIRGLIDEKMKATLTEKNKIKNSQEVTYKFLSAIAGDLPNFEDSIRYLYRSDRIQFIEHTKNWPADIINHALDLADQVFNKS